MPGITLRMARPEDAGGMLAVYAPYVEHSTASWEYEAPSLAEFSGRLREHLDTGFPWLLAEEDGAVLGYAYAGRFAARRGYDWDAEVTVYLSAAAHRRHAATALYTALLALLRRQGYVNCFALITHPHPANDGSSPTQPRPAPPSTSGWALPKPRACPTRATRTAGGWVFPIISSRCSRFLPCPCRLCR